MGLDVETSGRTRILKPRGGHARFSTAQIAIETNVCLVKELKMMYPTGDSSQISILHYTSQDKERPEILNKNKTKKEVYGNG